MERLPPGTDDEDACAEEDTVAAIYPDWLAARTLGERARIARIILGEFGSPNAFRPDFWAPLLRAETDPAKIAALRDYVLMGQEIQRDELGGAARVDMSGRTVNMPDARVNTFTRPAVPTPYGLAGRALRDFKRDRRRGALTA
jgi:hypothetical protein